MKSEKSLKQKIIWYFVWVTFTVAVVNSIVDSTFETFIFPMFYDKDTELKIYDPISIIYLLISFTDYIVGGFVFYNVTKKAIKKENEKRIAEQNLLYASIAHDLKTPLTSVQGFAEALADEKISEKEKPEIYDIIYNKSKSMNELVNTLFEYSKLGTEEYRYNYEQTDICVLVRDIIAENYCELEEHDIDLVLDIPDTPILINVDKKEIKRAFTNLVVNSYKHNNDGIKLLVRVKTDSSKIKIVFADTGNDIAQNMNIFEPFVTENAARTIGHGTGLGLAITKRIIERNGGNIVLSHTEDGYTKEFVVSLNETKTRK